MKKILIIEDDQSIAEVEKDYLTINNFDVEISYDGQEGLKKAIEKHYDLIIIDLMLPGIDGFKICKEIRKVKDIPLIMVTAKKSDIDKVRGFGLGLDDYLTKPFSPHELVARVKAHMNRYESLSSKVIDSDDYLIKVKGVLVNLRSYEVYVNGELINLTSKEFDLLKLLIGNPGRVFTKSEIFEKVWGYASEDNVPTVTVHIRKIREKIEFNPAEPEYIKTIWGVGYKFEK
ncbi:MAG TPA: response regulator transcription factor [Clostridia bacterium]|nr:response regulator transcription factor [Clostridia bacterium]